MAVFLVSKAGSPINFYRVTEQGLVEFDPWYSKIWYWFKGDVRTVIISAITALITAFITILVGKT